MTDGGTSARGGHERTPVSCAEERWSSVVMDWGGDTRRDTRGARPWAVTAVWSGGDEDQRR
jgi:hypothetical protein